MNYDKAYELARAIRESEEYRALQAAHEQLDADPDAKRMFEDFRRRQWDLQVKQIQGEDIHAEEMETLQRLYETLQLHSQIRQLLERERHLMQIMEDINKIIAEPLQALMK